MQSQSIVLLQLCVLGELPWLRSQEGSVSHLYKCKGMLAVWHGYSSVDVSFLDTAVCFWYCYVILTAFESFSLPEAWEEACHVGDICDDCLCSLRIEKPPILNQCHCNTIYQTWMVKWNTALSSTESSCCPSLRKVTCLKSEFFYCSTGDWHYFNFF